ncbi:MAG: (2Fe-2S)-binding protein [Roseiflexaceae bacterium]
MELTINGQTYTIADLGDTRPLLNVIRDELNLTGTKIGCAIGICGACTVHVDGVAVRSCQTPVNSVIAKDIRTIEGLADADGTLHPVQQAFLELQVPQCGWCMSGQMMTAAAFLADNDQPSAEAIVDAMDKNYCRCGTYHRIRQAVARAAAIQQERNA